MSIMLTHTTDNNTGYYLEGVQYDKNTWESLMEKKNLQKELENNLSNNPTLTKKPKI